MFAKVNAPSVPVETPVIKDESELLCRVIFAKGRTDAEAESITTPFIILSADDFELLAFAATLTTTKSINKYLSIIIPFKRFYFPDVKIFYKYADVKWICVSG